MLRTSAIDRPVNLEISGTVAPATARRVTVLPRRSWKVRPVTPAFLQALRQLDLNPSLVHGMPSELQRMVVAEPRRDLAASSARFRGAPTGMTNLTPVFPCRSLIYLPS